jgi:hypothetical protein
VSTSPRASSVTLEENPSALNPAARRPHSRIALELEISADASRIAYRESNAGES